MRTEGRPSASAVASATGVVSTSCAAARSTAILNWRSGSGLDINVIARSNVNGRLYRRRFTLRCHSGAGLLRRNQRRGTIAGDDQGHYPRRRLRHPAAPVDAQHQQAAAAGLQQADDLLPAVVPDAGGDPRRAHHHDAAGSGQLRAAARRRTRVRRVDHLRRAAEPRWPRAGVHHRARVRRRQPRRPGARRQHFLRRRVFRGAPGRRGARPTARPSSATRCAIRSATASSNSTPRAARLVSKRSRRTRSRPSR